MGCLILLALSSACEGDRSGKIRVGDGTHGGKPVNCKVVKPKNVIEVNYQFKNTMPSRYLQVRYWDEVVWDQCVDVVVKRDYTPIVSRPSPMRLNMKAEFAYGKALPSKFHFAILGFDACSDKTANLISDMDLLLRIVVEKPADKNCAEKQNAHSSIVD